MDGHEQGQGTNQRCRVCAENGQQSMLQLFQINQTEAVFLCPKPECTYPLGTKDLALVPRNASEVLSQRRRKAKNKKRAAPNISKKDPVFLKTPNSNANQSMQLGNNSYRNQQNFQHNQLLEKPQPDVGRSLFGSQQNLGVKKSAFTPYTRDVVGTGQTTHSYNESPVASSSTQPTAEIIALPSFLEPEKPAAGVPKPNSHEEEDIGELLNNLPDFENPHELDSKLSDLFSDLEAQPLASTDAQSDSGIFDISHDPSCLDLSFIEAGVEELGVNHTPLPQVASGSSIHQTLQVLTSEPQRVVHHNPQKDAPVKVLAERNTTQYLQWKNVDALCWLDVCLCLLVHSAGIAHILQTISLPQAGILTTILQAYKKAQALLHKANSLQTLSIEDVGRALKLETSIGRVSVKTGGGELGDLFTSSPVRLLPSGELSTSPHTPNLRSENLEEEKVFRYLQSASEVLQNVRENVWAYLYPKLKCERGKNDSPVFALPLLLGNHPEIEAKLMVKYEWRMICDVCGYLHKDKVQKVLPTFPQVPPDFTMLAPCFKRSCFQCQAPNQTMDMILENGLPDVLTVHFVEGLWRVNLADYDFSHRGSHYAVSGVVQYTENPSHFVTWIRNVESDSWMECNDLKSPVCQYTKVAPSFPPSQVHLVVWERQDASRQKLPSDNLIFNSSNPVQHQPLENKTLESFTSPQAVKLPASAKSSITSEQNCDLLMEAKPLTKLSTASTLYATPGSNVASVAHTVTPVTTSTWSTNAKPMMQSKVVNSLAPTSSVHLVSNTSASSVKSMHVSLSGPSPARSTQSRAINAPALATSSVVGSSKDQTSFKPEMGRTLQIAKPLPVAVPTRRIGNLLGVQSAGSTGESSEERLARMRQRFQKQKLGQVAINPIPATPARSKTTKSPKSTTPLASRKMAELLLKKPAKVGILKQSGEDLRDYVRSRYNFQEAGKQVFAGYKSSKSGSNAEKLTDATSQVSQQVSRKRKGDALATKPKSKAARMDQTPAEAIRPGRNTEQAHPKAHSYPQVPGINPLLPKTSQAKCIARQTESVNQMPLHRVESQSQASGQPPPVSRVIADGGDYTIQTTNENPTSETVKDEVPVLRLELSTGSGRKTITLKRSGVNKEEVSEESLQSILRQICSSLSGQDAGGSVVES